MVYTTHEFSWTTLDQLTHTSKLPKFVLLSHPRPCSAEQMVEIVRLVSLGKVKPTISRVYPLDQAPRALEDMGARKVVGKVVIDTRSEGRSGQGMSPSTLSRL